MNWATVVSWVTEIGTLAVVVLVACYLPSYIKKKAENLATKEDIGAITREVESVKAAYSYDAEKRKNLATKEDIADITRLVESVKAVYAGELESLRAALGARSHLHQTRYEREYPILLELTEKLVDLRNAALSLRPALTFADREKSELRKEYFDAERALTRFCDTRRPFFPEDIYRALYDLGDAAWGEAVQHQIYSPESPGYWDNARKNSQEILELSNKVLDRIRERVQFWERFDAKP